MKHPVTIVTGFLGSGKTTLLSRLLDSETMRNAAVLVNEFGKAGLDHHLLRRVEERTTLLGGGCVCCATREDLVDALLEILEEKYDAPVERVIVETTGLAEPAPILHTIYAHPVLSHHFFVDCVISTVDALSGETNLDHSPEAAKQIASCDSIVVTKTDAAEPETTRRLTSRLRPLNPSARLFEASFGEVDAEALLQPGPQSSAEPPATATAASHEAGNAHTVSLTFDGAVDWTAFGVWLSMLLHARGENVLRVKGLLDVGEAGPVVLNGVQHTIHPPEHLDVWPDGERRSRLTFITRGVEPEEITASLEAFAGLLGARPLPLGVGQPTL